MKATLPNVNYLHAAVLLRELAVRGVRRVVISPGSRSLPLAHSAMNMPEFEHYVLLDERSAAFFALGLSRADGVPAVLICTSGTAAANYYPAIIEAAQSQIPLIALTADRPLALRGSGAPQTINQVNIFGSYPKYFADVPGAAVDPERCRAVRAMAAQAFFSAMDVPSGPVHLNVPFDEPLAPVTQDEAACQAIWESLRKDSAAVLPSVRTAVRVATQEETDRIFDAIERALCGLIVCGPNTARRAADAAAIHQLARQLGWPVLADIASGLRFLGQPVLSYYDIFLREEDLAVLAPDVVLAFGAYPTSKVLNTYLDRHRGAHTIRIQPHDVPQDPATRATETIVADVAQLCNELSDSVEVARDSLLLDPFQRAAQHVQAELEHAVEPCEAMFVRRALRALPGGTKLVLASSLSIRYADALAAAEGKMHDVCVMRGANGIDGTISFASGVAAASGVPTLLVIGDVAFHHDMNGLLAARLFAPNLTVLLLNNDGGGIFHFLPGCETSEHFEFVQGTPHGLDLSAAKTMFGVNWERADSLTHLEALMARPASRTRVIEVTTSRVENHRIHCALFDRLARAAVAP